MRLRKLDPRVQWRNPVMFVVYIGSILTTRALGPGARRARRGAGLVHPQRRDLAVVHRAVRELRRSARRRPQQGAGGGAARTEADACRPRSSPTRRTAQRSTRVRADELRKGDVVLVEAGDYIPADGEVIEGAASVDESAITGESAPVIRESGGDFSAVTGGTRVLSDWIIVRVTVNPGRDLPRPHDRHGRGRQAPEDAERDRAHHPAGGAHAGIPARDRDAAAVLALQRRGRASSAPRSPSPR